MAPAILNLEPVTCGDRWKPFASVGPVLFQDDLDPTITAPPTFPLTRARMQFRRGGQLGLTYDSDPSAERQSAITIVNTATWFVTFAEFLPIPLVAGIWDYDLEFYSSDAPSAPLTIYRGQLIVHPGKTRP